MKIDQNSTMRSLESKATPATEVQSVPVKASVSSMENAAILKEAEATIVGQQKMTTEAKSISNMTAGLLQKSLADALPARSVLLNKAADQLRPKFPEMLVQSGKDLDKLHSLVQAEFGSLSPVIDSLNFDSGDIEQLISLVMMQCAKTNSDVLRDTMNSLKDALADRQQLRQDTLLLKENAHKLKDDDD